MKFSFFLIYNKRWITEVFISPASLRDLSVVVSIDFSGNPERSSNRRFTANWAQYSTKSLILWSSFMSKDKNTGDFLTRINLFQVRKWQAILTPTVSEWPLRGHTAFKSIWWEPLVNKSKYGHSTANPTAPVGEHLLSHRFVVEIRPQLWAAVL